MKLSHSIFPVILSALLALTVSAPAQQKSHTFKETLSIEAKLNYLLYLPKDYNKDPKKQWPLLIFLHGAGERGNDIDMVKMHGPPMLAEKGKHFPFIILSPQCPKDSWWTYEPIMDLIEKIESTHRVDSKRIYLTGLSMGGYGTWALIAQYPHKFAAAAPVCGGGHTLFDENRDPPSDLGVSRGQR